MKIRNVLGLLALTGSVVGTALTGIGSASASEINCRVADGCGTLHGINAVGTPVVLDVKRQANLGIDIGYPDLPGDRASALSFVKHEGRGKWTYADKTFAGSFAGIAGLTVTVANGSISFSYALPSTPAAVTAPDTYSVGLSGLPALPSAVALTGTGPFIGSTAVPAWLRPGTYTVAVTLTDTPASGLPAVSTGTLTLTVTGNVVYVAAKPFYTIVYVTANGTWTSDCVTALGNGLLRDEPCTLGRAPDQMFQFFASNAGVLASSPAVLPLAESTQAYAVKSITTGAFLEDQSGLSAAATQVPQSDTADAVIFTGRELDANGTSANTWTFGS
jgi:hypothetical protein